MLTSRRPADLQSYYLGARFKSARRCWPYRRSAAGSHVDTAEDAREVEDGLGQSILSCTRLGKSLFQRGVTIRGGMSDDGTGHSALFHHDLLAISLMHIPV